MCVQYVMHATSPVVHCWVGVDHHHVSREEEVVGLIVQHR
jgi:hypothetical protein